MAITTDIVASYRHPRRIVARRVGTVAREDRALAILMAACLLIFVAQWPALAREAQLGRLAATSAGTAPDQVPDLQALMVGRLFATLFVVPLAMYAIAAVVRLVARALGGHGTFYSARIALFWSLLATTPLMLLQGLVAGLIGPGPAFSAVGVLVLAAFLFLWVNALIETERGNAH